MLQKSVGILTTAILLAGALAPGALAARFIDLSGNWAERYVNALSDDGVIPAAQDGKFAPDKPVTRAALASWLVKLLQIDNQPVPDKPSFPDVKKSDWFFKAVEIIRQNNYISGYADGFRPNQFIQKGEVLGILARALGGAAPDETTVKDELSKYNDGERVPDWARSGVAQASRTGILVNHPNPQIIGATNLASKAEAAALLFAANEYLKRQSISQAVRQSMEAPAAQSQSTMSQSEFIPESQAGGGGYVPQTNAGGLGSSPQSPGGLSQSDFIPEDQAAAGRSSSTANAGAYVATPPASASIPTSPISGSDAPPGAFLEGGVTVLDAGTHFRASLNNTLDSSINREGDEFVATVVEPVYVNGLEAVPVGSKLIGQITNVVSARHFNFGKNGRIDVKFIAVMTPDGRRFPISATIDMRQLRAAGGANRNPAGRAAGSVGKGALRGAKWGGGVGAITSAAGGSSFRGVAQGAAKGAIVGSVLGAGVGLVGAGVKKGAEVRVTVGVVLPVKLDSAFSMATEKVQGNILPRKEASGTFLSPLISPSEQSPFSPPPSVQAPYGYPTEP